MDLSPAMREYRARRGPPWIWAGDDWFSIYASDARFDQVHCEKSETLRDQVIDLSAFFGLPAQPFGILPDGTVLSVARVGHEFRPVGGVATSTVTDGGGVGNDPAAKGSP